MKAVEIVGPLTHNFAGDTLASVAADLESASEWSLAPAYLMLLSMICRQIASAWDYPVETSHAEHLRKTFSQPISDLAAAISTSNPATMETAANSLANTYRDTVIVP